MKPTLEERFLEVLNNHSFAERRSFSGNKEAVPSCVEITKELMKGFLEWANDWRQIKKGYWINPLAPRPYITTAQLVDKFLSQHPQ